MVQSSVDTLFSQVGCISLRDNRLRVLASLGMAIASIGWLVPHGKGADMHRILVVDDEPRIRSLLAETLRGKEDAEIDEAAGGVEALRLADETDYDLCLLDLRMPGMDGLEVLARLREVRPDVPVIMLTAHGTTDAAVQAMKAGATDFLEKPFESARLKAMVRRLLDTRQARQQEVRDYATHFQQAKECVKERHMDAAMEHLRLAIALVPERPEAFNMLGAVFEMRNDPSEAGKHYRVAWHLDPTYRPAGINLERVTILPREQSPIQLGELRGQS